MAFNQQINAVVPNVETDPYFLYTMILMLKKSIQAASTGGMKGIVSKSKFEAIQVIEPPFKLQSEFGVRFKQSLELVQMQAESSFQLADLFQSLLHRAFRGEL